MALNTIADLKTEVLVRGQQTTSSGHITEEMLNDWLTEKHRWAASYKKWPFTEGRVSTTFASLVTDEDGNFRGDYPEGWKPDSIRLLRIDGKKVTKRNFQAFHQFREQQPDANDRLFTDYGRLYYINPNIDISGTIAMWGQYTPLNIDVTDHTATTIFSNVDEDGNEAIVEAMLGEVYQRSNKPKEASLHFQKSTSLLTGIWEKVKEEQSGYTFDDAGMFEHVDVLAGGMRDDLVRRDRWY